MNKKTGNDLFIVDNSDDDWKALSYLTEWSAISSRFDIVTAYFEIGALLALDGKWQKLDQIRILMGDEVTKRTQRTLVDGISRVKDLLDDSIEREKQKNDFLTGVPAIVQAIENGKIKCRVYTKKKFHAKACITHSKLAVVGSSALVGLARTGPKIEELVWSLMRSLQRSGLAQVEGRGAAACYRKTKAES